MPIYKIRLSKARAENLHAKLRQHYHCNKNLLPLAIQAARDYLCIVAEIDQDTHNINQEQQRGILGRFLSKDT